MSIRSTAVYPASFTNDTAANAGTASLLVAFTDTSALPPTAWAWDFGDGDTSVLQNPTHTFTLPGSYNVVLTATIGGFPYVSETTVLVVSAVTSFTIITPVSGVAPFSVSFVDTSQGIPLTWAWDFGDGGTSVLQNPTHSYTVPGTYAVTLTPGPGYAPYTDVTNLIRIGAEYTLSKPDSAFETQVTNSAAFTNVRIPTNAAEPEITPGMVFWFAKVSPGYVNFLPNVGVTLDSVVPLPLTSSSDTIRLIKTGTNSWRLGSLTRQGAPFTKDILVNNATFGLGAGSDAGSVAVGVTALFSNTLTTLGSNVAVGNRAMYNSTVGIDNVAVGFNALTLGTTPEYNVALGSLSLSLAPGSQNTGVGYMTLYQAAGTRNVAAGYRALALLVTGSGNVAVGSSSLSMLLLGSNNIAIGDGALAESVSFTGFENIGIGANALRNTSSGGFNIAVGSEALVSNTAGERNSAFGRQALLLNESGGNNVGLGYQALRENVIGHNNVGLGNSSLGLITTGNGNTAVGTSAGYALVSGGSNIFLGKDSGSGVLTGNFNTYIGSGTIGVTSGNNNTFIGANATYSGLLTENIVVVGDSAVTDLFTAAKINAKGFVSANATLAPFAFAVQASGVASRNTSGYPLDLMVSGGTVTLIEFSRDNVTYYPTGIIAGIIPLSNLDYIRITHSVAPTVTGIPR